MKVIDLLNKIANGEEVPKQIKARGVIWEFDKKYNDYHNDEEWFFISGFDEFKKSKEFLELKVEIIEEDKEIEYLKGDYTLPVRPAKENEAFLASCLFAHEDKINEIIKTLNELKKGE